MVSGFANFLQVLHAWPQALPCMYVYIYDIYTYDPKICVDPRGHKPHSFGQLSSLHLVLTEIKSKIENTGIAPTALELNT